MSTQISLAAARKAFECPLPSCGERKGVGYPFCVTHWAALPLPRRWAIDDRDHAERAEQAFAAAFQFLQGIEPKTQFLTAGERRVEWRYRTHQELVEAGYRFVGRGQCASIRCNKPMWWYLTPNQARMPIDPETAKPHSAVCLDPGYHQRVKEYREKKRQEKLAARRRKRELAKARRAR